MPHFSRALCREKWEGPTHLQPQSGARMQPTAQAVGKTPLKQPALEEPPGAPLLARTLREKWESLTHIQAGGPDNRAHFAPEGGGWPRQSRPFCSGGCPVQAPLGRGVFGLSGFAPSLIYDYLWATPRYGQLTINRPSLRADRRVAQTIAPILLWRVPRPSSAWAGVFGLSEFAPSLIYDYLWATLRYGQLTINRPVSPS